MHARSILCHANHGKEICYQFEDEPDVLIVKATPEVALPVPTITPPVVAAVSSPLPIVAATSVEDAPIKAIDILSVIIAQKLKKKRVNEIPLSKTIRNLVCGKSTLQNDI